MPPKIDFMLFEEDVPNATCENKCCDVCESETVSVANKNTELELLVSTIDELGNRGEENVTEWIRGGQLAWMKDMAVKLDTVYRIYYSCY